MSIEAIVKCLVEQSTRVPLQLRFKDGTEERGYVTYVQLHGTGRVIDSEREVARKFNVYEVDFVDVC